MGCVLYELVALHVPFESTIFSELAEKVCKGSLPTLTGFCSEEIEKLCMGMLRRDTEQRLSARSALQTLVLQPFLGRECAQQESSLDVGCKRAPSPGLELHRRCAPVRQRIDGSLGIVAGVP